MRALTLLDAKYWHHLDVLPTKKIIPNSSVADSPSEDI